MNWEAFFTLHRDLPREGPGEGADVLWALEVAGTPADAAICDAACGPGADTMTLAEACPEARVDALDKVPHFAGAARAACARFGDRVSVRQGDMAQITGTYDLIWCAGAVYFLGVTEALTGWRPALAPGGAVAFSEPVWLSDRREPLLVDFWQEYPALADRDRVARRIAAAGYEVLGSRILSDAAWEAYYDPIDARIARLRAGRVTPELADVLGEAEREAMIWRQYRRDFGYALFVAAPQ